MFGKLSLSDEITEFQLWQAIGRLVRELSYRRVNIFRSIIFFSPETAAELHLADHKAWEKYIEQHIRILAQKTASVHSCNGLQHITTSRAIPISMWCFNEIVIILATAYFIYRFTPKCFCFQP